MTKSKSKKRKLNHANHSHQNNGALTHEEIWDDSALLRSWNDAVAEYDFYHSIHAKGEDLDEVLKRYETDDNADNNADTTGETQVEDDVGTVEEHGEINDEDGEIPEEGEVDDDDDGDLKDPQNESGIETDGVATVQNNAQHSRVPHVSPATKPSAPFKDTANDAEAQTQTQTRTLENVKMAYYWAGYYSGLYDGQQRQSSQHSKPTDHT